MTYKESRLWTITMTATLSLFLNGYELGVFNTSINSIADVMDWSGGEKTFFTSICTGMMNLGALFGAILASFTADRIGRRKLLIYNALIAIVASVVNIQANTITFVIGRFMGGIVGGIGSTVGPVYVNEYAPAEISGKLGSMVQMQTTMGILVAYIMGLGLSLSFWWRIMFGFPIIIAVLQIILFLTSVKFDTPKYLAQHGTDEQLIEVLRDVYEDTDVDREINNMKAAYQSSYISLKEANAMSQPNQVDEEPGCGTLWCSKKYRRITTTGIVLSLMQQLSGINSIIFYSSVIFVQGGGSESAALYFTIAVGVVNCFSTLVSTFGADKMGRRFLFILGALGMFTCDFLIGLLSLLDAGIYGQLALMFVFLIFFGASLGPGLFIYGSEISTQKGMSIITGTNWVGSAIIGFAVPFLLSPSVLNIYGTFFLFAFFMIILLIFTIVSVKETSKLSRQEIQKMLLGDD